MGMTDIDYTGACALRQMLDQLDHSGVSFTMARTNKTVRAGLARSGLLARIGGDQLFASVGVALATNVPGPRRRLRMMGRDVLRLLPIPPIALHLRTGIAMLSYGDDLVFGITADYDAVPDVDELADGIERAVARLVAISEGAG